MVVEERIKVIYHLKGNPAASDEERAAVARKLVSNLYLVGALEVNTDMMTDPSCWTVEATFPAISTYEFGGG